MLNCYIVDDEPHGIKILKRYIIQTPGLNFSGSDTNPMEAWRKISDRSVTPDLLFLDIDMPQLSGIDLARLIGSRAKVIFTTAHPDYGPDAFEVDATDYLLKPISYERFLLSINKTKLIAQEQVYIAGTEDEFYVKATAKGTIIRIEFDDIIYIKAKGNYVEIKEPLKTDIVYMSLKELEEKLPSNKFIRVHKSFIIHIKHITSLGNSEVVMGGKYNITVGPSYRKRLLLLIHSKLIN